MRVNRKASVPHRTGQHRVPKVRAHGAAGQRSVGQSDSISQLEETAPERWDYVVYRNGTRVKVTKEEYETKYHPGSDDQV